MSRNDERMRRREGLITCTVPQDYRWLLKSDGSAVYGMAKGLTSRGALGSFEVGCIWQEKPRLAEIRPTSALYSGGFGP
jgi:hypothetical protein